jgi:DNA repair protein RadC
MQAIKHISECLPAAGYDTKEARLVNKAITLLKSKLKKEGACVSCVITASTEARLFINLALADKEREVFLVMFLDNQNRIIESAELFQGTINSATIHPREVVKAALAVNAAAVILAHNHPSGETTPSEADKRITKTIKAALDMVDIKTLDHIIVGGDQNFSFAAHELI